MALTDDQRAFLNAPNFGVLATTNPDGTTQQTLMWYGLYGDTIVMNAATGRRKLRNMQERPDVSVCVVSGRQYVTVQGKAIVSEDRPDIHFEIGCRYQNPGEITQLFRDTYDHQQRATITISIDHVIDGLDA